MIAQI